MSGQCQELKKWKSQNFDEDFMEQEVSDHSRGSYGELRGKIPEGIRGNSPEIQNVGDISVVSPPCPQPPQHTLPLPNVENVVDPGTIPQNVRSRDRVGAHKHQP